MKALLAGQMSLFDMEPTAIDDSWSNPLHWRADDWQQDNPKHFVTPMEGRPSRCAYCGHRNHRDKNYGTWIYPGCTPTTNDPSYKRIS